MVQATLTSSPATGNGSSVYFVSVGPNTTDWLTNYTPISSVTIGVTTITLSPVQSSNAPSPTTTIYTTLFETMTTRQTDTSTLHPAFPLTTGGIFTGPKSFSGWNATRTSSTLAGGVSGSVTVLPIPSLGTVTSFNNLTSTLPLGNTTVSPMITATSTLSSTTDIGYGYESGYAFPGGYGTGLGKRQICTLVSATISGEVASWCNNWDGSSIVVETSFSTTCKESSTSFLFIYLYRYLVS